MSGPSMIAGMAKILALASLLSFAGLAKASEGSVSADLSAHARDIVRGRNIVLTVNCNDCHTAGYARTGGHVSDKKWLLGDAKSGFSTPSGVVYAPNLRAFVSRLSESQWIEAARKLNKRPPMPQHMLRGMSDADLKALYWFIRSLDTGVESQHP